MPEPEPDSLFCDEGLFVTVPSGVDHHEAPRELLRQIHMIYRNGQLVQPGEYNDYTLDMKGELMRIKWNIPLDQEETVCVFCPTTGSRWAWSPQCGVFVDIRKR